MLRVRPRRDAPTATSTPPRRSTAGAWRCSWSAGCLLGVTEAEVAERARPRSGPVAAALPRRPVARRCAASASPARTARPRPPTCLEAIARAAGRAGRADRHHRRSGRGDAVPLGTRRPRRPSSRRCSRGCATAGSTHRRDGGLARTRSTSTGSTAPGSPPRLHEPLARPPRLPRHDRRLLRGQGAAVHARARGGRGVVNVDDAMGATLALVAGLPASDVITFALDAGRRHRGARHAPRRPTARRSRLVDARSDRGRARPLFARSAASTSPTRSPAAATALVVGVPARRGRRRARHRSSCPGRLERVDAGQPFTVLVDYAHTPDALDHALRAPRELAGAPRDRRCSAAAATATAASARSWARRGATPPTSRCSPPTIRARRRPTAIAEPTVPVRHGGGVVQRRARPARGDRARARRTPRRATSWCIAGKGHETGPDDRRDDRAVRRPGGRARGAGRRPWT